VHRVPWLVGAGTVSWSRDGRRVAYASPLGIFAANADGSGRRRLTVVDPQTQTFDADPRWSPDGRWIVFAHEVPMHPTIELIRADGSGRRRVTAGEAPSWAPDGRRIAFQAGGVAELHVFVVDVSGSNRRQITASAGSQTLPDWSPGGREIVFVGNPTGVANGQLYAISADGSGTPRRVTKSVLYDSTPAWSRDGRWIVFSRGKRLHNFSLYLVRADGSGLRRLTFGSLNAQLPEWRPATRGRP
jgi:TolB protein